MRLREVRPGTSKRATIDALRKAGACGGALAWCERSRARTAEGLWQDCPNPWWMLWLVCRIGDPKVIYVLHRSADAYYFRASSPLEKILRDTADHLRKHYESPWLRIRYR